MIEAVIADAGPLIGLARIRRLDLLFGVFRETQIPPVVEEECCRDRHLPGAQAIRNAIERDEIKVVNPAAELPALGFPVSLGPGERAVLELAVLMRLPILMDDRPGRKFARSLGVATVGTGGLLLAAKSRGRVDRIAPLLRDLVSQGYRLSADLVAGLLARAGESGDRITSD